MGRKLEFCREKALRQAMESFRAQGYAATSMRVLAGKLGLHLGSVYNTLGSKEKLFEDSLKLYFETHVAPRLDDLRDREDALAALDAHFSAIVDENGAEKYGCFIFNSLHEITAINPDVTALLHDLVRRKEEAFTACVAQGQESGGIDRSYDPLKLARFLVAMQFSLRVMARLGVPPEKVRDVKECLLQGIRQQEKQTVNARE